MSLTGKWRIIHDVHRSQRERYEGLKLEFHVSLAELGGALVGSGSKVGVNERSVPEDEISLLEIGGRDCGSDTIELSLFERRRNGRGASIVGEIVWKRVTPDHMLGRFRVDVGNTVGRSEAFRIDGLSSTSWS
jgi:hypothetical protein